MQIGEVIRKYRKRKNMTQEEMAQSLGVTAPAVNKWENGGSMPDILLLAPIARLLGITLDTLLSFREELTQEEINRYIYELNERLKNSSYEEAFQWARERMEEYPNCEKLFLQMGMVLDVRRLTDKIPDAEKYDEAVNACYVRALDSRDEETRYSAAGSLFGFFARKEAYGKAEEYLQFLSSKDPEKKRKQAELYARTGRRQEAYETYEGLLFSMYTMLCMTFYGIFKLAMEDKDVEKARFLVDKQESLAELFDMSDYNKSVWGLELATAQKDADAVVEIMGKLLSSLGTMDSYASSPLYEHMHFRENMKEVYESLKNSLLECFRNEETYDWLQQDKRWQELVKK